MDLSPCEERVEIGCTVSEIVKPLKSVDMGRAGPLILKFSLYTTEELASLVNKHITQVNDVNEVIKSKTIYY